MAKKIVNGRRFGRLIALNPTNKRINRKILWHCRCDCGNEIDVLSTYLTTGATQSCGCLKKEVDQGNLREGYNDKRINGVAMQLFKDQNPRKDSTTGYRGVSKYLTRKNKEVRYRAWITVNGKRYYKSGFLTAKDAYFNGRLDLEQTYLPNKKSQGN